MLSVTVQLCAQVVVQRYLNMMKELCVNNTCMMQCSDQGGKENMRVSATDVVLVEEVVSP